MCWLLPIVAALLLPIQERPVGWLHPPRLFNPTAVSVTVAAIPEHDAEVAISYGDGLVIEPRIVRAGALYQAELTGLSPGSVSTAVVRSRSLGGSDWSAEPPLRLPTLKPRGQPVHLALAADTHAWALHSHQLNSVVLGGYEPWFVMQACLARLAAAPDLDFVVAMTDTAMTRCGFGCQATGTSWGPASGSSVSSLDDALVRYRATWSVKSLGQVALHHPMIVMRGDHEGEAEYQAYLDPDIAAWSRMAREATLPAMPEGWIHGPPGSDAWALETGDLLLVALDVHSFTNRPPDAPQHWHLGAAQHAWLADVLSGSRRVFKVVMAEHLVGGISGPTTIWKGRGGITATEDGTATGVFLGEQALVHATMLATGADLFIGAHDHVVAYGEKDGVTYLIAGRAGGVSQPWADQDWYAQAMDYDGDGVPEYDSETHGTRAPGHVRLDVTSHALHVSYVRASTDPALDGQVLLEFTLEH